MNYTYSAYKQLLAELHENQFSCCGYQNWQQFKKPCILRHDIDFSIEKAVVMAELEQQMAVQSTYFVLLSTEHYNIHSALSQRNIQRICSCGHAVGLHFDETRYTESSPSIPARIEQEAKLLSMALSIPIQSVSMHIPSRETLEGSYEISGLVNAYSDTFFRQFKYISDSRRRWRENPHLAIANEQQLHILTHPFWYNEQELNLHDSISRFVNHANAERYQRVSIDMVHMDDVMGEEEIEGC